MISPAEHEKVFKWLYDLSKRVSFDIKTTAAQHYRRVVIQQKMREAKDRPKAMRQKKEA
jgi:AdoMet-dependent heme synthase